MDTRVNAERVETAEPRRVLRGAYDPDGNATENEGLLQKAVPLGELVLAAFDEAAHYSSDPREVSRLATWAVANMLRRARRIPIPSAAPATCTKARDAA